MKQKKLSTFLGWFSIGLGVTELVAGRKLGNSLGLFGRGGLMRSYGVREIATGVGILLSEPKKRGPWLWGRVVGDAIDLATLFVALGKTNPNRGKAAFATANVAAVTGLDVYCAQQLTA
jgi:hypothetical protein